MPAPQGRYWLLTIAHHLFTPYLPEGISYIKGQLERGRGLEADPGASGFLHWQVVCAFPKKVTLFKVKEIFGEQIHGQLTRSDAANTYCFKEDTRVGHQFELGSLAIKRNSRADWDDVLENVKKGRFSEVPSDILIRCYGNLKKIHVDSLKPSAIEREVYVYWGKTGTGKSRLAWEEAGIDAYPKDPNSKFWDGYSGQEHIVIDEFRGAISISHILRWLDRYPVIVEVKGSSVVFKAQKIWITSNLDPKQWYNDLDEETYLALRRRFTKVIHFDSII